jgi:hypothetical protein
MASCRAAYGSTPLPRFAADSTLEERGFELLVPLSTGNAIEHTLLDAPGGTPSEDTLVPAQGETSGSNPFCSTGESVENLSFDQSER